FIFALHNEVYGNAFTSGYQGSGIGFVIMSQLGAAALGEMVSPNPYPAYSSTTQDNGFAPFHIMVLWNVVHDNGCTTSLGSTTALTTTGTTHASTTLDGLASVAGLAASQLVLGPGIQPMTYIQSVSSTSVTLTRPATATANGGSFQFLVLQTGHTD